MEALKVDIVSPSGQLVASKNVATLVVPSMFGELTILAGHIDMVCLLGKGYVKLDDDLRYIIYNGIMEISDGNSVVIAAERTTLISDLNKQMVINSVKEAEERLSKEMLDDKGYEELYQEYLDRLAELNALNQI